MSSAPNDFICPLTQKVMTDPVQSPEGVSFEREAILKVLSFRSMCPVNGTPLRAGSLRTNTKLQWMILFWKSQNESEEQQQQQQQQLEKTEMEISVPPRRFFCPLTREVMVEPVTIREGSTFEKAALVQFIEHNGEISPTTGKPLGQPCFYPNMKLAWDVKNHNKSYTYYMEEPTESSVEQEEQAPSGKVYSITLPSKSSELPKIDRGESSVFSTKTFMQNSGLLLRQEDSNKNVASIIDEVCDLPIAA